MKSIIGKEYISFLNEIKSRIISARIKAVRSVNKELIKLYWDIGRSIIERQEKYKWGNAVVEKLANDLKEDFKSTFGFSVQNLWYMRQFYLEYKDDAILQQLVGESCSLPFQASPIESAAFLAQAARVLAQPETLAGRKSISNSSLRAIRRKSHYSRRGTA